MSEVLDTGLGQEFTDAIGGDFYLKGGNLIAITSRGMSAANAIAMKLAACLRARDETVVIANSSMDHSLRDSIRYDYDLTTILVAQWTRGRTRDDSHRHDLRWTGIPDIHESGLVINVDHLIVDDDEFLQATIIFCRHARAGTVVRMPISMFT